MFWDIFKAVLPSLLTTAVTAYTSYQANEQRHDQEKSAELQRRAAAQQLTQAGMIEQQATQQENASREAARLSELNAIDAEVQNIRSEQNLRNEQQVGEAEGRARAAASGITVDGSSGMYLSEQEKVNREALGWLAKTGRSAVARIRGEGGVAQAQGKAQAAGTRAAAAGVRAGAAGTAAGANQTDAAARRTMVSGAKDVYSGAKTIYKGVSTGTWF